MDEVFGLSSSSKYAPGYAEAIQSISKEANQAKKTEIDRPLAVLLKAIDEGKTTVERKVSGKKIKIPISQAVEEFNKKSSDFAKKYNIRGPKINLGGNFNLTNYFNFRPESRKNIEQVFKDKNYFLSEVNNKPVETITSKITRPGQRGFIDRQLLADVGKFAGRAAQAGFLTPTGVAASTLGLGGLDLTSPVGRIVLGAELAGAPELVKASIGATKGIKNRALQKGIQQFLNLGLPTRLALKAARVASPLGIALTTGEGLYQAGKFAKKRMDELQAMSPEQRQALRARQAAFAFEGAREGGIIGKKSGPPPVSGPMPHGLPYETKGVKKQ